MELNLIVKELTNKAQELESEAKSIRDAIAVLTKSFKPVKATATPMVAKNKAVKIIKTSYLSQPIKQRLKPQIIEVVAGSDQPMDARAVAETLYENFNTDIKLPALSRLLGQMAEEKTVSIKTVGNKYTYFVPTKLAASI